MSFVTQVLLSHNFPGFHHHLVGLWGLSDPKHRGEVWLSCILWPDELETAQQGDQDQEELHAGQSFPKTSPGPYKTQRIKKM